MIIHIKNVEMIKHEQVYEKIELKKVKLNIQIEKNNQLKKFQFLNFKIKDEKI